MGIEVLRQWPHGGGLEADGVGERLGEAGRLADEVKADDHGVALAAEGHRGVAVADAPVGRRFHEPREAALGVPEPGVGDELLLGEGPAVPLAAHGVAIVGCDVGSDGDLEGQRRDLAPCRGRREGDVGTDEPIKLHQRPVAYGEAAQAACPLYGDALGLVLDHARRVPAGRRVRNEADGCREQRLATGRDLAWEATVEGGPPVPVAHVAAVALQGRPGRQNAVGEPALPRRQPRGRGLGEGGASCELQVARSQGCFGHILAIDPCGDVDAEASVAERAVVGEDGGAVRVADGQGGGGLAKLLPLRVGQVGGAHRYADGLVEVAGLEGDGERRPELLLSIRRVECVEVEDLVVGERAAEDAHLVADGLLAGVAPAGVLPVLDGAEGEGAAVELREWAADEAVADAAAVGVGADLLRIPGGGDVHPLPAREDVGGRACDPGGVPGRLAVDADVGLEVAVGDRVDVEEHAIGRWMRDGKEVAERGDAGVPVQRLDPHREGALGGIEVAGDGIGAAVALLLEQALGADALDEVALGVHLERGTAIACREVGVGRPLVEGHVKEQPWRLGCPGWCREGEHSESQEGATEHQFGSFCTHSAALLRGLDRLGRPSPRAYARGYNLSPFGLEISLIPRHSRGTVAGMSRQPRWPKRSWWTTSLSGFFAACATAPVGLPMGSMMMRRRWPGTSSCSFAQSSRRLSVPSTQVEP